MSSNLASSPEEVPTIGYDQAAQVGRRLQAQIANLLGDARPGPDDLVWADLVQFVLSEARLAWSDKPA